MNIHYITPYATDKNFGRAINDTISHLPDEDWICLRDGDSMFLTPDWGLQIYDVVNRYGSEFAVFGCVTNRLASRTQIHDVNEYDNHDIAFHYKVAKQREHERWAEVTDITRSRVVAGMFMLFSKQTWSKVKFKENTNRFDSDFCERVIRKGGRLGLIQGVYAYHWYRGWSDSPRYETKHLDPYASRRAER